MHVGNLGYSWHSEFLVRHSSTCNSTSEGCTCVSTGDIFYGLVISGSACSCIMLYTQRAQVCMDSGAHAGDTKRVGSVVHGSVPIRSWREEKMGCFVLFAGSTSASHKTIVLKHSAQALRPSTPRGLPCGF